MIIPVLGMDPSLLHWGLAEADLDLGTGYLTTPTLTVLEPVEINSKQVRVNSNDLYRAEQLAKVVIAKATKAKAVFVECPVGSQSARAMASYGICVGILGALRASGVQLIEVTASEVKSALTGNKTASKRDMIDSAISLYPEANFPVYKRAVKGKLKGQITATAEHVADAIGAIHAGVQVPLFQNLMKLYQ